MNSRTAHDQYKSINTETGVVDADPHRLIQMLFNGALSNIAIAKGCLERKDMNGKGEALGKAVAIVSGLADSLRSQEGGEDLVANLASLYDFSVRRLTQANLENDINGLVEVENVLKELQAGWNEIRPQALAMQKQAEPA